MPRIKCFLLDPNGRTLVSLRRYRSIKNRDECPAGNGSCHNASVPIEEEQTERDKEGHIINGLKPMPPRDDPRWPKQCHYCGYAFQESDDWQRDIDTIYRRTDTGEEMTIREAPVGAMWYAPWLDRFHVPQDDKGNLMVKTPGGDWAIDSQSSNCTMKDDRRQEKHHCWIRHGIAPNITVDKQGITCSAGAGSIQCNSYHGFLRSGYLED
jgi:hypothetical protein